MSRYLVISDIHSNLEALDAVLAAAAVQRFDRTLVLGDLVGYGADPNAVVERIRDLGPLAVVRGNHDKVAAGIEAATDFNPLAKSAAMWTRDTLLPEAIEYLRALPGGPIVTQDEIEISHGSPLDEDLYIVAPGDALRSIEASRQPLSFFGHTHVAMCAQLDARQDMRITFPEGRPEFEIEMRAGTGSLVNPGSVGQPRDGDSRAAYAIADMERRTITLYRTTYAIAVAQQKILDAGLPAMLAHRLGMGR